MGIDPGEGVRPQPSSPKARLLKPPALDLNLPEAFHAGVALPPPGAPAGPPFLAHTGRCGVSTPCSTLTQLVP